MLKEQSWLHYGKEMRTEYLQCKEEGLAVAQFEEACGREMRDAEAAELGAKMLAAPMVEGYPYVEPSDYEGIMAQCSALPAPSAAFDEKALYNKIKGAFAGRVAGCMLGKPVEGKSRVEIKKLLLEQNNYPLARYIKPEIMDGAAAIDDDINYTVYYLRMIEKYGRDFIPDDCLEGWIDFIPGFDTCTAERVAYRNGMMGLLPPETAAWQNPYREWIGAEIRADFFGYVNAGRPEIAANMAWRDGTISHVKNGIYGEMFSAALIAAIATLPGIMDAILVALSYVPEKSRLYRDISKVIALYNEGKRAEAVIDAIHAQYTDTVSHDWCHTNSNVMVVVYALLYGEGDFEKSICLAVQDGFDTDCNGATVGSVLGMRDGFDALPMHWIDAFDGKVRTSIIGDNLLTLDQFTQRAMQCL